MVWHQLAWVNCESSGTWQSNTFGFFQLKLPLMYNSVPLNWTTWTTPLALQSVFKLSKPPLDVKRLFNGSFNIPSDFPLLQSFSNRWGGTEFFYFCYSQSLFYNAIIPARVKWKQFIYFQGILLVFKVSKVVCWSSSWLFNTSYMGPSQGPGQIWRIQRWPLVFPIFRATMLSASGVESKHL